MHDYAIFRHLRGDVGQAQVGHEIELHDVAVAVGVLNAAAACVGKELYRHLLSPHPVLEGNRLVVRYGLSLSVVAFHLLTDIVAAVELALEDAAHALVLHGAAVDEHRRENHVVQTAAVDYRGNHYLLVGRNVHLVKHDAAVEMHAVGRTLHSEIRQAEFAEALVAAGAGKWGRS